ncbi:MAG: hypothetical protein P8Y54_14495, partial [Xanthomonadales bacterium]
SGYSAPASFPEWFTVVYEGDIWVGCNVYPTDENTWNPDNGVFDAGSVTKVFGGTTQFSGGYNVTSIQYDASLAGATTPGGGHTVTVTFERNCLKADATGGTVQFVWGYAPTGSFTELGSVVVCEATTTTSTTTTTVASTTSTTAASTTTTTSASTTSTTSASTTSTTATATTTTVAAAPGQPVPTLGAIGIPLLVSLMGAIGLFGLYRRK